MTTENTPTLKEATMADQNENTAAPEAEAITANPTLVVAVEDEKTPSPAEDAPEAPAAEAIEATPEENTDTDTDTDAEAEEGFFNGEAPKATPEDDLNAIEQMAEEDVPPPEEVATPTEANAEVVEEVPEPPTEAVQAEVVPPARPRRPTAPVAAAVAAAAVDVLVITPRGPAGPQGPQGPAGPPAPNPNPVAPVATDDLPPPPRRHTPWYKRMGCWSLILLAALLALLALGLLTLGGGIATWMVTRPAPAPAVTVVEDGGTRSINGSNALMLCRNGENDSVVRTPTGLTQTTVPTGLADRYWVVEFQGATFDPNGVCLDGNGNQILASTVLAMVKANDAGKETLGIPGVKVVHYGIQRF